ncbi:hypothetical protein NHP164001_08980 [Helicobacter trogontum]|uniref:Uncharacterized protein n=1 Tax=Helicobacter trogontum TaxID=50960 RepID=A0ABQ0D3G6_9HELI
MFLRFLLYERVNISHCKYLLYEISWVIRNRCKIVFGFNLMPYFVSPLMLETQFITKIIHEGTLTNFFLYTDR